MPCQTSTAERLRVFYQLWCIRKSGIDNSNKLAVRLHVKVTPLLSHPNYSVAVHVVCEVSSIGADCNAFLSRQCHWLKCIHKWTTGLPVQVGKAYKIATSQQWKALPWYTDEWTWFCSSQQVQSYSFNIPPYNIALDLDKISTACHCWSVSNTLSSCYDGQVRGVITTLVVRL